jgi:uncharacterized Zn finger protein
MRIKEKNIREHTGEQSLLLGREYAQRGAIFDTKQQGDRIKARCEGSRSEAYRLWARIDNAGNIIESGCACPVAGRCKHVAALLLVWRSQPEDFIQLTPLHEWMARRSHQELQSLITQMLSRAPELEDLIETPTPKNNAPSVRRELDANRRQIRALLRRLQNNHEAIAQNIQSTSLVAAQSAIQREAWIEAASSIIPVISEVLQEHEEDLGAHPTLIEVLAQCVSLLGQTLSRTHDDELREVIIQCLLDVYRFDVEAGGLTLGDEIPGLFLRGLTPEEACLTDVTLRASLDNANDWAKGEINGFLQRLLRVSTPEKTSPPKVEPHMLSTKEVAAHLQQKPSLESYRELRRVTNEATREEIKQMLREQNPDLLRQIFIDEGDFSAALALLPPMQSSDFLECYPHLLTAKAAEESLPQAAIDLYLRYATLHQAQQNPTSCKETCRVLARVKALYLAQQKPERWLEALRAHQPAWRDQEIFTKEATAAGLL